MTSPLRLEMVTALFHVVKSAGRVVFMIFVRRVAIRSMSSVMTRVRHYPELLPVDSR